MTIIVSTKDKYKYINTVLIKYRARERILQSRLTGNDLIIDNFLKQKYNQSLKQLCLKIITNTKCYYSIDRQEIIIKILNKKLNDIADLIMFGNGTFVGSNILKLAFSYRKER